MAFAFREKAQEPVPVQVPPLQPTKVLPEAALAVKDTVEPAGNVSVQVLPQLMAPPVRVMVPLPVPILAIDSTPVGVAVKLAITLFAAFMVTEHVPVPEQSPAQPEKLYPVPGAAVSVTTVPLARDSVQSVPQLMPAGELVTVPVPDLLTDRSKVPDVSSGSLDWAWFDITVGTRPGFTP